MTKGGARQSAAVDLHTGRALEYGRDCVAAMKGITGGAV